MITTRQVSALRPRRPTLALLTARQLLEAPVEFFDLPAPVTGIFRHVRRHGLSEVMGNDPVKGAVWGDQLEYPHLEGDLCELDYDPVGYPLWRPLQLLYMNRPLRLADAHQAIALQCGEEGPLAPVNQLQILRRGVPALEQERARLDLLLVDRVDKPLLEMVILGLAINVGGRHAIVKRIKIFVLATTVHQTHDPNPPHDSLLVATVLGASQSHEPAIAFSMHAIIHNQTGVFAILNPVLDQLPHFPGHEPLLAQKIIDHVVAHVFQVLGQIGTRTVLRRAYQILDVLLLGNHDRKMLFFALKRKSCLDSFYRSQIFPRFHFASSALRLRLIVLPSPPFSLNRPPSSHS